MPDSLFVRRIPSRGAARTVPSGVAGFLFVPLAENMTLAMAFSFLLSRWPSARHLQASGSESIAYGQQFSPAPPRTFGITAGMRF